MLQPQKLHLIQMKSLLIKKFIFPFLLIYIISLKYMNQQIEYHGYYKIQYPTRASTSKGMLYLQDVEVGIIQRMMMAVIILIID